MLKKNMMGVASIEFNGTVLQNQCDKQHRPTQRIAGVRLANRFMPSRNLLAPKLRAADTGHIYSHYNFVLKQL